MMQIYKEYDFILRLKFSLLSKRKRKPLSIYLFPTLQWIGKNVRGRGICEQNRTEHPLKAFN